MKRLFLMVALGLVLVSSALAANVPDPRLDAIAAKLAGHPVVVNCKSDDAAWADLVHNTARENVDPLTIRAF